jgi:hypothetical protein
MLEKWTEFCSGRHGFSSDQFPASTFYIHNQKWKAEKRFSRANRTVKFGEPLFQYLRVYKGASFVI